MPSQHCSSPLPPIIASLAFLLAAGCASEAPVCDQAIAIVENCQLGIESDLFIGCAPESEAIAEELVSLHEEGGCSGIAEAADRADGCLFCKTHEVEELAPFTTDGCSFFPDGTIDDEDRWQACCVEHDFAYYVGGTFPMRDAADVALDECVSQSCSSTLGGLMYSGVRVGGTPAIPSPWRWGYGWKFDPFNGYRVNPEEFQAAALAEVQRYKDDPWTPESVEPSIREFFGQALDDTIEDVNNSLVCD